MIDARGTGLDVRGDGENGAAARIDHIGVVAAVGGDIQRRIGGAAEGPRIGAQRIGIAHNDQTKKTLAAHTSTWHTG